jgi:tryptophan synthase alpha chain
MQLAESIRARRRERELLLMAHVVVGYPSLSASLELVDAMVSAGADLLELQIPFSEPIADGPVIASASQRALANGISVDDCLEFAARVTERHAIPFVFMSYYNILCRRGIERFVSQARDAGLSGVIVPDCRLEDSAAYVAAMREAALAPIFLLSPRTPDERLRALGHAGDGLAYAVARKGVTGAKTEFSSELEGYLARCRRATELPLAVGFGLESAADVRFLVGKADVAVVGSQALRVMEERGIAAVAEFVAELSVAAAH